MPGTHRRSRTRTMGRIHEPIYEVQSPDARSLTPIVCGIASVAVGIYLVIALASPTIAPFLAAAHGSGTFDGNLAGQLGGFLANTLRGLLGGAAFLTPCIVMYFGVGLLRRKPAPEVARVSTAILAASAFSAMILAAISPLFGEGSDTVGGGGALGHRTYTLLVGPLGPMGALLLPVAALATTLSLVIDYETLGRKAHQITLWLAKHLLRILRTGTKIAWQVLNAGARHAIRWIGWGIRRIHDLYGLYQRSRELKNERGPQGDLEQDAVPVAYEVPLAQHSESANTGLPAIALFRSELPEMVKELPLLKETKAPSAPLPYEPPVPAEIMTDGEPSSEHSLSDTVSNSRGKDIKHETMELEWAPPSDIFTRIEPPVSADQDEEKLRQLGERLVEKLAEHKIEARLAGWTSGPTVVCFHVIPAAGIKVNKFTALEEDLAIGLRQKSVRVTTVPESGAIGIEMARPTPRMVTFSELYDTPEFRSNRKALPIALGLDLNGRPVVSDLAKMPHLLVAGATGSGKSVALNVLLTSLCATHPPEDMRLILVDPKRVEMAPYQDLPHLRHPVIYDAEEVAFALKWTVAEMERRYDLLREVRARNIFEYEEKRRAWTPLDDSPGAEPPEKLPFLIVVIDELADLMMIAGAEIETLLVRIAQKARAVGIHLVLATQRPTVQVITGLIKANVPSRMAFRVVQRNDSRTILDQNGADALLGNGDMLFLPPGQGDVVRIQGAFISTAETERFVEWCRTQRPDATLREEEDIIDAARRKEAELSAKDQPVDGGQQRDPLFAQALDVCIAAGCGSTSLLQRKLGIGYGKAARIIDQLVEAGYLGESRGSKPRPLLQA